MSTCPNCGQSGLSQRISKKTGRPYLAHVETYPNGASYFRALHDSTRCAAYTARIAEMVQQERDLAEREAWANFRFEMHENWRVAAKAEMDALEAAGTSPVDLFIASQAIEAGRPTAESLLPLYEASRA